jgi:hypothetical protein
MKHIIVLFYLISLVTAGFSQDLIVKMDDQEIIARIHAIKKQKILYKEFEAPQGELLKIPKSEVYMVIFEDGLKQYFSVEASRDFMEGAANSDSVVFYYDRGVMDAERFFQNNGPFWGTFAASAVPVYGIFTGVITGTIVGAIPPQVDAGDLPNPELFYQNNEYAAGYQKEAHRQKVRSVLKGFGLGMAIQTVFILIVLSTF